MIPRLVIAAPQGRSGKTTVTLGLSAAFADRGLRVQVYKKGPDFIDPSWLSAAAGRACRTLDPFFLSATDQPLDIALRRSFRRGIHCADLALIEGNHGLYDSALVVPGDDGSDDSGAGSTAAVGRALDAPVILVVNAARMGRSVAALVNGYQNFEPDTSICGVILNQVSGGPGSRHAARLRIALEKYCRVPVLGILPREAAVEIPDRYLGLVPRGEQETLAPAIEACRQLVEYYVDLETVLELARKAPAWEDSPEDQSPQEILVEPPGEAVSIGLIRDRAFSFYYPENLEALEAAGANLVFINALQDSTLPQVDALVIGGGFPEMFMDELEANSSLRGEIHQAIEAGLPVYAECGGLMYLSRRLYFENRSAEMVGILPIEVEMVARPQGHGYVQAQVCGPHPFLEPGTRLRGHEFHHSRLRQPCNELASAYCLSRGRGLGGSRDGLVYRNLLAGYLHLHADSAPTWAPGMVRRARQFAGRVYNRRAGREEVG